MTTSVVSTVGGRGTVPAGGATGEALVKNSASDYDLAWAAASAAVKVSNSAVAAAADYVARIKIAADTTYRLAVDLSSGNVPQIEFGSGGVAAVDVRLYRSGVRTLGIDGDGVAGIVEVRADGTTGGYLSTGVTGDAFAQSSLYGAGMIVGPGGAAGMDTRLFRAVAGQITLDPNGSSVDSKFLVKAKAAQRSSVGIEVNGDTAHRLVLYGDATLIGIEMGSGAATRDVSIRRVGAGTTRQDANGSANPSYLQVEATVGQRAGVHAQVNGDAFARAALSGDATLIGIEFGTGAAARDTNLYRSAANVLKTDDALQVVGVLNADSGINTASITANGPSMTITGFTVLGYTTFLRGGGSAFPGSPATNDRYFRTDLGMEFFYDGTRWLSTQLFHYSLSVGDNAYGGGLTATFNAERAVSPYLSGGSDLWIVQASTDFLVSSGGTALGASHSWIATLIGVTDGGTATTTLATLSVNSGASAVARNVNVAVNALMNNGVVKRALNVTWTKTGTPGAMRYAPVMFTYRVVAT